MVQITMDVPEDMKGIIEKAIRLRKTINEQSKLTEKDVEELTNKINEAMWKRHKKYGTSRS